MVSVRKSGRGKQALPREWIPLVSQGAVRDRGYGRAEPMACEAP